MKVGCCALVVEFMSAATEARSRLDVNSMSRIKGFRFSLDVLLQDTFFLLFLRALRNTEHLDVAVGLWL